MGCGAEAAAFTAAVQAAAAVFEEARAVGFHPDLLDIGGGFPGASDIPKGPGAATDIDALNSFEVVIFLHAFCFCPNTYCVLKEDEHEEEEEEKEKKKGKKWGRRRNSEEEDDDRKKN